VDQQRSSRRRRPKRETTDDAHDTLTDLYYALGKCTRCSIKARDLLPSRPLVQPTPEGPLIGMTTKTIARVICTGNGRFTASYSSASDGIRWPFLSTGASTIPLRTTDAHCAFARSPPIPILGSYFVLSNWKVALTTRFRSKQENPRLVLSKAHGEQRILSIR